MRRRDLIKGLIGSVIAWPLKVDAQQTTITAIVFLSTNTSDAVPPRFVPAFLRGLSEGDFVQNANSRRAAH
jgi:hypothetical protein